MGRQVTRPVRESDAQRRRLYLPQVDTLWLPVSRKGLESMRLIDSRAIIAKLGLEPIKERVVLAVSNVDFEAFAARLERERIAVDGLFTAIVAACPSIIPAFRVPNASLDDGWLHPGIVDDEIAVRLMLKLAIRIKHVQRSPVGLLDTDATLDALKIGYGNCFTQVAVLAAAFRKNGVAARIVGRKDFFGSENGDHWWVEAFVEGEWQKYDPRIQDVFLGGLLRTARERRLDENGTIQLLWERIAGLTGTIKTRITPTEDPAFAEKTEFHTIAAEIEA